MSYPNLGCVSGSKLRRPILVSILVVSNLIAATTALPNRKANAEVGSWDRGLQELRALVVSSGGRPSETDLIRLESQYAQSHAASLARFLRGYLHYSGQNYNAAADALNPRDIGRNSSLADYALFYRAESESHLDAASSALRDYTELYSQYGSSLMAHAALLKAAELSISLGDPDGALKLLAQLVQSGDAGAVFITAQAYDKKGRADSAIKLYRNIYFERPASNVSEEAAARLEALGASIRENAGSFEEIRSRADALFDSRQYAEAAQTYEELLGRFPSAGQLDEINLRRGLCLLNNRQAAQAIAAFSKVTERRPDIRSEALFYQADALRRSSQPAQSSVVIDRLVSQYPQSRWAQTGLYNLASYLDKQGRTAEAAARYRQLLKLYPKSEYAPEATYTLGWWPYQARRYAEAARALEQHLLSYRSPESKFIGESVFWAGKAHERLGNRARALALYDMASERYRYGYHGHVARARAAALRAADPALRAEQIRPGSDLERIRRNVTQFERVQETDNGSESGRVAKADDLELIGLGDLAIREMNQALESAPASPKLNLRLAQIYSRHGENFQATLVLRRAYPDLFSYADSDLPREAWEIFFPLRHWDAINEEARRYGIDPYIAAALIRQESVFNPNAISRVGARGLMQLMSATAQHVAKIQGIGQVSAADLYNPLLNIKLGMYYLSQRLGQFRRIEYAAAAYNAGPARVQQWLAERGSLDIEEWVETIPFAETRGYVQGVIRNAANYRRLYKQ